MPKTFFKKTSAFLTKKRKSHLFIEVVSTDAFEAWQKKQPKDIAQKAESLGFKGKNGQIIVVRNDQEEAQTIIAGINKEQGYMDFAELCDSLAKKFPDDVLKNTSFEFNTLKAKSLDKAHIGWGWACYRFDAYKSKTKETPSLLWAKSVDKKCVLSHVESVDTLRDLINTPANDMGPEEIEKAVAELAKTHNAELTVIKDQKQLKKDFPLIHTVGKASPRLPRLIELKWGKASHPKVTLVGKGVAFDTGGLDLKPSQHMRLMKKDMGGAAHAIALAKLIMDHNIPINLRLLVPAVENAVSGESFRPGDIIKSRKSLFVENTNTDAEGRLILADTLTYAAEDKPDLIIDFATLTGSARAALGPDIPALFSNDDKIAENIVKAGNKAEDPVWAMPLWQPYRKHIEKSEGDLVNSAGLPGDLIYSALFLESFIEPDTPWVHLDCYAWEHTGKPGRPVGGADTGLRAIFTYLEQRYG